MKRALSSHRGIFIVSLLIVFWALAVASRLLWNGDVYGLDFRVYHPDGACYSQFAYDMAGKSSEGTEVIIKTYAEIGAPISFGTNESGNPTLGCSGRGLDARVLYPALSVPFVILFGLSGMLVIPALSWLFAILVPAVILVRSGFFLGALIAGLLAIASGSIARWSVSNTADPLLMGLVALTLIFLPVFRPPRKSDLVGLAMLAMLGALVRQSFPIWIAIAAGPWIAWMLLNRKGPARELFRVNPWSGTLVVLSSSAIAFWFAARAIWGSQNGAFVFETWKSNVTSAITSVTSASSPTSGQSTDLGSATPSTVSALFEIWSSSVHAFNLGWNVIYTEFGQLVVLDRALLILLAIAAFGVWKNRRWAAGYMFVSVFSTTLAIGAFNSTLGINFRFQLSAVPFAVLMAGLAITSSKSPMRTQEYSRLKTPLSEVGK